MSVVLSPDVERQIEELVRSGRFPSAGGCVRTCIGFFQHYEQDQAKTLAEMQAHGNEVRRLVAEGIAAFEQGDYFDYDDDSLTALLGRIKREAREVKSPGGRS